MSTQEELDALENARPDYHDPTAGLGGAAPALSPLTLRLVLASFGLFCGIVGVVVATAFLDLAAVAVVFGVVAVTAAIDVVVITRRKRRGEPG